jgi:hypothetical protein
MIILPTDPLCAAIIARVQQDLPIEENPIGSNRSPEIDAMCERWGVPLASYWCALWTASVWADAGADVPPTHGDSHPAKCESWRLWALSTSRFSSLPTQGAAVLYGKNGREPAEHIGACVMTVTPLLRNAEGNTTDSGFSREGELTAIKPVNADRLIGYISPHPLGAT